MATAGPNSPTTTVNDTAVGTIAWVNPNNSQSENGSYATFTAGVGATFVDTTVKLVIGGTVSGDNKSAGAAIPSSLQYRTFGGAADLWGLSLSDSDVNAADFGVVYSSTSSSPTTSNYLKATNFGFSIPSGATIDGVTVEIKYYYDGLRRNHVDHIRITVTYTESGGGGVSIPVVMHHLRQQGIA